MFKKKELQETLTWVTVWSLKGLSSILKATLCATTCGSVSSGMLCGKKWIGYLS